MQLQGKYLLVEKKHTHAQTQRYIIVDNFDIVLPSFLFPNVFQYDLLFFFLNNYKCYRNFNINSISKRNSNDSFIDFKKYLFMQYL